MSAAARWTGLVLLAALLVLPLTFGLSMAKNFNHDEHQHLAAGALLAREGLLPYKDFPYFHTPHLVFVYGWLFRSGSYFLLKARAFSAVCAALTAGVLFAASWHTFQCWNPRARWIGSLCALALLLCSPLFYKASGQAWNHDPSTLCALASVVLLLIGPETSRPGILLLGSGLSLGLATGFRITWAPIALPMLCLIALAPPYRRNHVARSLAVFSVGAILGLAPLLWLFAIAPEQTIFSNFEFPKVNIAYRFATGEPRTMTVLKKARYFLKEVAQPEFGLGSVLAVCGFVWWRARRRTGNRLWLAGLAAMIPFIFIGSFAPSPLYYQYFYAPVPFLILLAVSVFAAAWSETPSLRSAMPVLVACLGLAIVPGAFRFSLLRDQFSPSNWTPLKNHAEAQLLLAKTPPGRVLTLAPTPVIEAGFGIYPAFSTGAFAWRVAPFIAADKRSRMGIVSEKELRRYLDAEPPAAILLGFEKKGEKPLAEYAVEHRFVPSPVGKEKAMLWLRPAVSAP